jgi:pyridinium-3,5-bisthiocarboxylic acid mononucleotide nickel chelatase
MILYLDCAGGASGDMLTAALCAAADALGHDGRAIVRGALVQGGIDPQVASFRSQPRGGLDALGFSVAERPGFSTFPELEAAVESSALPEHVKRHVASAARRMAAAEEIAHGHPGTHLHELAGIDTAVDLISACSLAAHLAPARVVAAPPALGSGWVSGSHGRLTVPAPAVLALLAGLPTAGAADLGDGELTTPTGAALLAELADEFGPLPAGRIMAVGVGSGEREIEGRANVLRAVVLEPLAGDGPGAMAGAQADTLAMLETTVDDLSPEYLAAAVEMLREAGARDAWLTPVLMKKGRPGVTVHALAEPADVERLAGLLFAETSTFGVRVTQVRRLRLDERHENVAVDGETVGVRLGYLDGRLATASPEFEDCARASRASGTPARLVHERAQELARRLFAGS